MTIVTMHQAKTNLSRLVAQAISSEEVIIARGTVSVARIVPFAPAGVRRRGALAGQIALGAAFFDPLPNDELDAWGED